MAKVQERRFKHDVVCPRCKSDLNQIASLLVSENPNQVDSRFDYKGHINDDGMVETESQKVKGAFTALWDDIEISCRKCNLVLDCEEVCQKTVA